MQQMPHAGMSHQQGASYDAPASGGQIGPNSYVGNIKTFSVEKGYGHIDCPDTFNIYGKDILLLRTELHRAEVRTGDTVSFSVTQDDKGIKAVNVQVIARELPGTHDSPTFIGAIKSFNHEKGWGLIMCEDTHRLYRKDILVLRTELNGANVDKGDQVSFNVKQDSRGLKAANVHLLSSKVAMLPGQLPPNSNQMSVSAAERTGMPPMDFPPLQYFRGVIKTFDEQKGYGFIICEETQRIYNKDIFVLRSQLHGQPVFAGDQIQFTVSMGAKGPAASDVVVLSKGAQVGLEGFQPVRPMAGGGGARASPY